MSGWADLAGLVVLRVLLIRCFLSAGLVAHQSVFSEMSPQESLTGAWLQRALTVFDISQTMLKPAS